MMRSLIDVMLMRTTYWKRSESQEDESPDGENEDTMNTICSRIADALVNARGR